MFVNNDIFTDTESLSTPPLLSDGNAAYHPDASSSIPPSLPSFHSTSLSHENNDINNIHTYYSNSGGNTAITNAAGSDNYYYAATVEDRYHKIQQLKEQELEKRSKRLSIENHMIQYNHIIVKPIRNNYIHSDSQSFSSVNNHANENGSRMKSQSIIQSQQFSQIDNNPIYPININDTPSSNLPPAHPHTHHTAPSATTGTSHPPYHKRSTTNNNTGTDPSKAGSHQRAATQYKPHNMRHKNSNNNTENINPNTTHTHTHSNSNPPNIIQHQSSLTQSEKSMLEQGISPTFDPIKPSERQRQSMITSAAAAAASGGTATLYPAKLITDVKAFVTSIPPRSHIVQCHILRNRKGLTNRLYPQYDCYLQEDNLFLLSAKKKSHNKTSNYIISNEMNNFQNKSSSYVGKVRSNFVGTEFVSYDRGLNPKHVNVDDTVATLTVRQELAAVFYESNILGSRGPRKMVTLIPAVKGKDNVRTIWRPLKSSVNTSSGGGAGGSKGGAGVEDDADETNSGMITSYKQNPDNDDFIVLSNKTPKWNDSVGAYVLNFNGRVTQASVKNFQLISSADPEAVLLQFGRIDKDHFTMDYQWPLTALQAFQICLSSFDYKLACE